MSPRRALRARQYGPPPPAKPPRANPKPPWRWRPRWGPYPLIARHIPGPPCIAWAYIQLLLSRDVSVGSRYIAILGALQEPEAQDLRDVGRLSDGSGARPWPPSRSPPRRRRRSLPRRAPSRRAG